MMYDEFVMLDWARASGCCNAFKRRSVACALGRYRKFKNPHRQGQATASMQNIHYAFEFIDILSMRSSQCKPRVSNSVARCGCVVTGSNAHAALTGLGWRRCQLIICRHLDLTPVPLAAQRRYVDNKHAHSVDAVHRCVGRPSRCGPRPSVPDASSLRTAPGTISSVKLRGGHTAPFTAPVRDPLLPSSLPAGRPRHVHSLCPATQPPRGANTSARSQPARPSSARVCVRGAPRPAVSAAPPRTAAWLLRTPAAAANETYRASSPGLPTGPWHARPKAHVVLRGRRAWPRCCAPACGAPAPQGRSTRQKW
eukprot:329075-Chlamydomonas_euryale.AAC.4